MTARRLLLLLVAAVLISLGLATASGAGTVTAGESAAAPVQASSAPSESEDETAALDQSPMNAVPPARELGKPVAAPGLLKTQAHTEALGAEPVLVLLGVQDEEVPLVSRIAVLPVADGRAPPVRQVVA